QCVRAVVAARPTQHRIAAAVGLEAVAPAIAGALRTHRAVGGEGLAGTAHGLEQAHVGLDGLDLEGRFAQRQGGGGARHPHRLFRAADVARILGVEVLQFQQARKLLLEGVADVALCRYGTAAGGQQRAGDKDQDAVHGGLSRRGRYARPVWRRLAAPRLTRSARLAAGARALLPCTGTPGAGARAQSPDDPDLTQLLRQWRERPDDPEPAGRVAAAVYAQLKRLASNRLRNEAHTLSGATDLVHEAWLRLDPAAVELESRLHFFRLASLAM